MFGKKKKIPDFHICDIEGCVDFGKCYTQCYSPLFTCNTCHKAGNYYSFIEHCVIHGHECHMEMVYSPVRIC